MDTPKKVIELPECRIVLHERGYVEFFYLTRGEVDLALAKKLVSTVATLVSQPTPTLVNINEVRGSSREARMFFATSGENKAVASRVAFITNSPLSRIIGNFFMGLNKRMLPTRLFNDEKTALEWLLAP